LGAARRPSSGDPLSTLIVARTAPVTCCSGQIMPIEAPPETAAAPRVADIVDRTDRRGNAASIDVSYWDIASMQQTAAKTRWLERADSTLCRTAGWSRRHCPRCELGERDLPYPLPPERVLCAVQAALSAEQRLAHLDKRIELSERTAICATPSTQSHSCRSP
jgi:hypothetical protein